MAAGNDLVYLFQVVLSARRIMGGMFVSIKGNKPFFAMTIVCLSSLYRVRMFCPLKPSVCVPCSAPQQIPAARTNPQPAFPVSE